MAPSKQYYSVLFGILMLGAAGLVGCQSSQSGSRWTDPNAAKAVAVGDWNDVEAAAIYAVGQNETTIVSSNSTETQQVFHIRSIRDEKGTIVAQRDAAIGNESGTGPIHLSCSLGLFGNESAERSILDAMRRRLESLRGVDYRPIK
jgi:hypothetical protein